MKRQPMQVSEDTMKIFRQCHESVKAKSIGRSVAQTILRLRAEIKALKSKATPVEALEGQPEAVTKTEAPTPTEAGEPSIKPKAPVPVETPSHHKCTFRTRNHVNPKSEWVLCSKDYDRKGMMFRVTEDVCRECWSRIMSKRQGTQALAEA